jgi:dTDP-glucose pyrophosphorylase
MNYESCLLKSDATIAQAIAVLDSSVFKIVLVVDAGKKLLGTITDGDVRRGILKGFSLADNVTKIMSLNPITATEKTSKAKVASLMQVHVIKQIPRINSAGVIIGLEVSPDLIVYDKKENFVVLMAGGLGTRLQPLTNEKPKPMLSVGEKPILETIISNFAGQGFYKIFLSLNYKAELIKEHFADGRDLGVEIEYLLEEERLGTAGALGLLTKKTELPIIVMNADLLTKVSFSDLLNSHLQHKATATMCVREYEFQVPFGVVETENEKIVGIDEKPVQKFFVNAGIYVLNPEVITRVPKNQYLDMPALFNQLVAEKQNTLAFPVREYWIDIGRHSDFEQANIEYPGVFSEKKS